MVIGILTGLALGVAWLLPSTALCVLLGWGSALGLAYLARRHDTPSGHTPFHRTTSLSPLSRDQLPEVRPSSEGGNGGADAGTNSSPHHTSRRIPLGYIPLGYATASYVNLYLVGIVSHLLAFYWLIETVHKFGGFPTIVAFLIFLFFVLVSSLQFIIFPFLVRHAPRFLSRSLVAVPLAWVAAETVSVRIFPWLLGHTQVAATYYVQIADLGGARLVSFAMVWAATALIEIFHTRSLRLATTTPLLATAVALGYGAWRLETLSHQTPRHQRVVIAQANISIEEKHNTALIQINEQRYREISASHVTPDSLLIWPESVVQSWIPTHASRIYPSLGLPWYGAQQPALLIGALTTDAANRIFNSAVAALPSGEILKPYHKRILMPFGEYMPFGSIFPFLKKLMPALAEFTAGDAARVFQFAFDDGTGVERLVHVSPLICYEDVVPELARESTQKGAELLVNITNDAWFGDTAAPRQHHMIATFRAIENRRTLIRSTNSGLTAIVSPQGITTNSLPSFSEGILIQQVPLLGVTSWYTAAWGELPWRLFSYWLIIFSLAACRKGRRKAVPE